jgi:dephospho-CoA kinase
LIAAEVASLTESAQQKGLACLVFDIPLLVESAHWRARLDRVVIVDCSVETQIARVQARSGLSEPEIRKILSAQSSRSQRLQAADTVIFNEGKDLLAIERELEILALQFGL